MAPTLLLLLIWFLMSFATGLCFWWDKRAARRGKRRIAESQLLWLSVLGGAAGGWIAMRVIRHKTQKKRFTILVPLCLGLHIGIFLTWLWSDAEWVLGT